MRRFPFCVVVLMILSFSRPPAFGSEIPDLEKRRQEIQSDIQNARQTLTDTRFEKNYVQVEISIMDDYLTLMAEELDIINEELERAAESLAQTEVELAQAEEIREAQQEAFKTRARFMYMNGKTGYLNIILRSADFADLMNRIEYVNRIMAFDRNIIKKLEESEALVIEKLEEARLHTQETQLLSRQQAQKLGNMEEALEEKGEALIRLLSEEDQFQSDLNALEAQDKEIEALIIEKQDEEDRIRAAAYRHINRGAPYTGGSMGWPLQSYTRLTSHYGNRRSPFGGRTEFHTGTDIAAPMGTNILAAESGVVISSSYRGGYGNTVIIDHGNGMSTLYAHASKLLCSPGDRVGRGDVIAQVGSTGFSTGPHLHFEVRINGGHTNPINYLRN